MKSRQKNLKAMVHVDEDMAGDLAVKGNNK
jgi:hypothetical protein